MHLLGAWANPLLRRFTFCFVYKSFNRFLVLFVQVFLNGGVEVWLGEILKVMNETVHSLIVKCIEDAKSTNYIDELAQKVQYD